MTKLGVYAWSEPGITNFGDELGPDILSRLGHRVTRVAPERAEVVVCGSVLEKLIEAPRGCVIAGAGYLHGTSGARLDPERYDSRALRGKLSWSILAEAGKHELPEVPLGDPGILAGALYETAKFKKYRVGVVPHYVDRRAFPYADVVIDVLQRPRDVIRQISQCHSILSSSLHGLIVAQSLGIPAQRLRHPRVLGGDLKWEDYASGVASGEQDTLTRQLIQVLEAL